jgi:hypothetical protein
MHTTPTKPGVELHSDFPQSRKRKSDAMDDAPGLRPIQPDTRRLSGPSPPTSASSQGENSAYGFPRPVRTLASNWVTANERGADQPAVAAGVTPAHSPEPPVSDAPRPRRKPDRSVDVSHLLDVSGVTLAGEATDRVTVFDDCDAVRGKIRAFLANPNITQAAFLRAIAATYSDGRRLQGAQLNRFLSMKGASHGYSSGIFYAAFVFFEKVRIRDGHPKSPERVEMERAHPDGLQISEMRNWGVVRMAKP